MLKILQFCWSLGGALAEFKDKAEESHVASFLNTDGEFWIGLNDLSEEGFQKKFIKTNSNSFDGQGSSSGLKPIKLLSTQIGYLINQMTLRATKTVS